MEPGQTDLSPKPPAPRSSWAWPVAWMVSLFILAGTSLLVFRSCARMPGEALEKTTRLASAVGQAAQQVAAAFKQGTINTTFTSYATTLSGSQYLQFATLTQTEVFTRTDDSSVLWGYVPLPDVVVQARAPVTYTYYLDLNDRWDFRLEGGVIWVTAPLIKFNKPAVDASGISYEVKKDSYLRRTPEALGNLKNSITGLSYSKARSNIALVRETGRHQTELFVENWLAKTFSDGKQYPVKVRFRNGPDGLGIHDASKKPPVEN
ncbi:MAG: hypothetical protein ACREIC_19505 [Limisphaerales bacterium]